MPLLVQQLKLGSNLPCRVTAARALIRREHPGALPAMIDEWRRLLNMQNAPNDLGHVDGVNALVGLLASSGSATAVRALAEGLSKQSVEVKLNIVSAFGPKIAAVERGSL